jgi:two-component system response regulator DesR
MLLTMKPDVLVIDYQLVGMTGFDCADLIREERIEVRTVMLTAHASSGGLQSLAREHGVEQVLSKDSPLSHLLTAIVAGPGTDTALPVSQAPAFSPRQREVLELMGEGYAPAEIAEALFVSIHTARRHVKDVRAVLGSSTQLAAVTTAIRDGHIVPRRETT